MDQEGLEIDIADALGKSAAAICIQSALFGALVTKGILKIEDAALISGTASQGLAVFSGLSPEGRLMAEAAIRGFATTWTSRVTRN